jgi:hypothetical protein
MTTTEKHYVCASAMTYVTRTNGRTETVYRGGVIPDDAEPANLKRLIAEGFVEESKTPGGGMQSDIPPLPDAD